LQRLQSSISQRQSVLDMLLSRLEVRWQLLPMQACHCIQRAIQSESVFVRSPRNAAQGAATALSDSIDRNTPAEVPERCSEAPSVAGVERILALAHRLSYTSFAPPGACCDLHVVVCRSGTHCPGWDALTAGVVRHAWRIELTAHGSEGAR
jgi:hypothetical protein